MNASFRVGLLVTFVAGALLPLWRNVCLSSGSSNVSDGPILDVSTMRGRIDVESG